MRQKRGVYTEYEDTCMHKGRAIRYPGGHGSLGLAKLFFDLSGGQSGVLTCQVGQVGEVFSFRNFHARPLPLPWISNGAP